MSTILPAPFLGTAVGACVLIALLAIALERWVLRPRRAAFRGRAIQVFIDAAAGMLVIVRPNASAVVRLPLGTLRWRSARVPVPGWYRADQSRRYTRRTRIGMQALVLPAALHYEWCNPGKTADRRFVGQAFDATVPRYDASALIRWLGRHAPMLQPNLERYRAEWIHAWNLLRTACRAQLHGRPAIECERFAGDTVHYLAIMADGRLRGADIRLGETPLLFRPTAVHASQGNRIRAVFPDHQPEFELDRTQLRTLQYMQRKGIITLEAALRPLSTRR